MTGYRQRAQAGAAGIAVEEIHEPVAQPSVRRPKMQTANIVPQAPLHVPDEQENVEVAINELPENDDNEQQQEQEDEAQEQADAEEQQADDED